MNSRDRVMAALNFEEADRIPVHDELWVSTVERWRTEGLPSDISPAEYFGYELVSFRADTSPQFPVETLKEEGEYIVETTPFGGIRRNRRDYSTTPSILDYACKNRADWERVKERLAPSRERVDWDGKWPTHFSGDNRASMRTLARNRSERYYGLEGNRQAVKDGKFTCYAAVVGYDKAQWYVATEELLASVIDDPGWVRDIYETDAALVIAMCDMMRQAGYHFDGAFLLSDLGYSNGPLFSPHHFAEQLHPTLQKLCAYFRSCDMPVIMHTDGRIHELIPYFVQEGVRCLNPLEVKAGMDLVALKSQWGDRLAFMGGIDVRAMAKQAPEVIEEEIRVKIPVAKRHGGYIYHSDQSVPHDVSLEQYRRVLDLVAKYGAFGM